jgi:parallel beta-helix repeat protein
MTWIRSRSAVVAMVAAVAVLAIALGSWQGWLAQAAPDEVYVNDNLLPDVEGCNAPDANTIADGITAADPGDTVVVCEGVYAGNVTVGKSVTIEGRADGDRADIVVEGGMGVDGFEVGADGVTIRHIRFDGVDQTGIGVYIPTPNGDATIQDVEVVNWDIGIGLDGSSGNDVEGCDMDQNRIGIWALTGGDNVIRDNVAGPDNLIGMRVEEDDVTLVEENDISGSDIALHLRGSAAHRLNVRVVRNTINAVAGGDGVFISVIDSAESLIVMGGRAEDANTFAGSPDTTAGEYFVEMDCPADSEVTVNATWNYWPGITDRADIAELIYGDEDDLDCAPHGAVVFHPWATEPAPGPSPSPTPSPSPSPSPSPTPGTRDFDLQMGWNNFVWTGASGTDPATVLSCIDGSYAIAYRFVAVGQTFERYVPGDAVLSNMTNLNQYDSLLVLVTASGVQCLGMPVEP